MVKRTRNIKYKLSNKRGNNKMKNSDVFVKTFNKVMNKYEIEYLRDLERSGKLDELDFLNAEELKSLKQSINLKSLLLD